VEVPTMKRKMLKGLDVKLAQLGGIGNAMAEILICKEKLQPHEITFILALIHATVLHNTADAPGIDAASELYDSLFRRLYDHIQSADPDEFTTMPPTRYDA
jgi:hypothetical protein